MQRRVARISGIFSLALILSGCINNYKKEPAVPGRPPITVMPEQQPEAPPEPSQPPVSEGTIPQLPKFQTIDWDVSIRPLITQMLGADGITPGALLMVAGVYNKTNGILDTAKATDALVRELSSRSQYQLVPAQQAEQARQALGLPPGDSLATRGKAIGLARAVNAQDLLYVIVDGDVKSPQLKMQLMLVQSGEIIWSGNTLVQQ